MQARRSRRAVGSAACLVMLSSGLFGGEQAKGFQWPAFKDRRFEEDWSVLAKRKPDDPTDVFDPIKYVPLSPDGFIWASFGGQVRERYEHWNNFAFRKAAPRDDDYLQSRFRLHGDFHLGDRARVFIELKSAHTTDRDLPQGRRTLDTDECDIQNAFFEFTPYRDTATSVALRLGRQELAFGKERLVSTLDWANTRRTFDAASAILKHGPWTATAFWGRLVVVDKYHANDDNDDMDLYGVYLTRALAGGNLALDAYWLGLKQEGVTFNGTSGTERRQTVGARLGGKIGNTGLDFDVETACQRGTIGGRDIHALMFASQLGYTWAQAPATPRVFVGFDYASGDDRKGGDVKTFNQLFPLGHAYLGYIDIIGRQNIVDCNAGLELKPHKKLFVALHGHCFRLADNDDALYNAGGQVVRAGGTGTSNRVGSEIDLLARYNLDRHQAIIGGYSHFFPGTFVDQSGSAKDIDFAYLIWLFTF
ncbi:MAG TPA: alginate export family protein [Planctomycetota bacterium]|nr:alginate export family protein [Planctomycetota bacterium]HRR80000.1 alginate export family protein [Planctomycetota bacterium]HRT96158.1 alginate export family protein [Planctomycetota bacterium]